MLKFHFGLWLELHGAESILGLLVLLALALLLQYSQGGLGYTGMARTALHTYTLRQTRVDDGAGFVFPEPVPAGSEKSFV